MILRALTIAVVSCTMLVGCKSCKKNTGTTPGGDIVGRGPTGDIGVGKPLGEGGRFEGQQQAGMFQAVHFAYDSAAINPLEQSKIQAVAEYCKGNPGTKLLIEGHCDERGTAEYNRALGERRALAVREALSGLNVDAASIQTISYGKDRPVDPGHDETAWAKNRRSEFVIVR